MKMVRKKEFATAVHTPEDQMFLVYLVSFTIFDKIHLSVKAQIFLLKVDETPITIFQKFSGFANVFLRS